MSTSNSPSLDTTQLERGRRRSTKELSMNDASQMVDSVSAGGSNAPPASMELSIFLLHAEEVQPNSLVPSRPPRNPARSRPRSRSRLPNNLLSKDGTPPPQDDHSSLQDSALNSFEITNSPLTRHSSDNRRVVPLPKRTKSLGLLENDTKSNVGSQTLLRSSFAHLSPRENGFEEPISPRTQAPMDLPSSGPMTATANTTSGNDVHSHLQNYSFPGSTHATRTIPNNNARQRNSLLGRFRIRRSTHDLSTPVRAYGSPPSSPLSQQQSPRAHTWPNHRSSWDRFLNETVMIRNALLADCDALAYQVNYFQSILASISHMPSGFRRSTSTESPQWPSRIMDEDGNPIPRVTTPHREPSIANPLEFTPPLSMADSGRSSISVQHILESPPPLLSSPVSDVDFASFNANHEWEEISDMATVRDYNPQLSPVETTHRAPQGRRMRPVDLPRSDSIANWRMSLLQDRRFSTDHFSKPLLGLQPEPAPRAEGRQVSVTQENVGNVGTADDEIVYEQDIHVSRAAALRSQFLSDPLWNITLLGIGAAAVIGIQAAGQYFTARL